MYKTDKKYFRLTGLAIILTVLILSCSRTRSDHPQAGKGDPQALLTKQQLLNYKDSINGILGQLDKQQSLIYTLEDNSFFVTKYSSYGDPMLYIRKAKNNEYSNIEERYYMHDGQLVLYLKKSRGLTTEEIKTEWDFFRNNILFYSEVQRSGGENSVIDTVVQEQKKEKTADMKLLEQALNQTGKFNLVFDGTADYPQAKYIILSRDELHPYRAALLLEKEDELAEELISNPEKYKGRKLDLQWKIRNGEEAVYVSGRLHH